jgi:hypothetical protein
MSLSTVAFVLFVAFPARQDAAPPAPTTAVAPVELKAGELPANASEDAKALWQKLVAATRVDPLAAKPTGFDLTFEGEAHQAQRQSNDFPKTRYRFDPSGRGSVRLTMLASGRERLFGKDGAFLLDGKEVVPLTGREHAEDRRQVNQELSIAKNFLALTDPKSLRVAKLEKLPAPPSVLPKPLVAAGAKLEWLAIESPDFRLFQSTSVAPNANWRVELGLDAATHLPKLVSVTEIGLATMQAESAMLVDFRRYQALDGFQVPAELETYGVDPALSPWKYSRFSTLKLGLCAGGTLRPTFKESDFLPPAK